MSVYCGYMYFFPTEKFQDAIEVLFQIGWDKHRLHSWSLTLPSGETIKTPFNETGIICDLDDVIRECICERRNYPVITGDDGSQMIELPFELIMRCDQEFSMVQVGSDLSDVSRMLMIPSPSIRKQLESIYAAGGVARLVNVDGDLVPYFGDQRQFAKPSLDRFRDDDCEVMIDPLVKHLLKAER